MKRIGEVFSDQEVIGDRELPAGTAVEAYRCIRVEDGWLAVEGIAGAISVITDRPSYQEPEDDYEGDFARVMPQKTWPPDNPYGNGHPRTLKIDPHTVQIEGQSETAVARWTVHHLHPLPRNAQP